MELKLVFHTDEPRLQEMCRAYWEFTDEDGRVSFTRSVSEVARAYGEARHRLAARVQELCEAQVEGYTCVSCDTLYVFKNRSEMHQRWRRLDEAWICPACLRARQEQIARERREFEKRQRLIVQSTYAVNLERRNVFIDEMSLHTAVYLLSLIRLTASEDLSYLRPMATVSSELPLAPTPEYSTEILNHLFQEGAIAIHPETDPGAFIWEGDEMPRFYTWHVMWALPCHPYKGGSAEFAEALEVSLSDSQWWPNPAWHDEWAHLWQRIALEECLQYLKLQMKEHGFDFTPGEKTRLILKNVLVNFSVSQAYTT